MRLLPIALLLFATVAEARKPRPLFEPTDFELEVPGTLEVDLQFGVIRGQGPWRLALPDFEVDLGLTKHVEFDLDGGYVLEGPEGGGFSFDHAAPDSLWPSLKVGLFESRDLLARTAWTTGLQLGPKLPVASGSHGLGFEGLVLVGHVMGALHLVGSAGGFVDPRPHPTGGRPTGVETGLDLDLDLDSHGDWSLTGELSAVLFTSNDPHQLLSTVA